MDDAQIEDRIDRLEQEERRLRADEAAAGSAPEGGADRITADRERLAAIKIELDQLWDLKRQRQALRSNGRNPDDARMRDEGTVEHYWQ